MSKPSSRFVFVTFTCLIPCLFVAAKGQEIQVEASGVVTVDGRSISLRPPKFGSGSAQRSWLDGEGGVLMLDDLLPQPTRSEQATIKIDLPSGWQIFSTSEVNSGRFNFVDAEKGVIFVGRTWRKHDLRVRDASLNLLFSGQWQFTDDDARGIARETFEHYQKLFGSAPGKNFQIGIAKFPIDVPSGNWEADTRGSSITILSSDMPFKTQSLQRLHEQLRHEMFHLWIPNGVNLTGNYDWFYEGFALYQSLKMGVAVNRLRFEDYLDTLSRAYDIDRSSGGKLSLIDASKNRWNGNNNTQVYARGMLVAFLCDLALLDASGGKRSTDDLLREIYSRYRPPSRETDGNEAVLATLRASKELVPIIDAYITGTNSIKWAESLKVAGIEPATDNGPTSLKVAAKPTGRQKNLLDKLGYNSWRKLSNSNK